MRFNSVFCALIFIILASCAGMAVFIQTESFGNLVSRIISDISEKKTQTKVSMDSISFKLLPPGVEVNRIQIEKKIDDGKQFFAELGKIGFYLKLIEIEEKKLSFSEVIISDAVIDYRFPESDEELKEIDQAVLDKAFAITDDLPVRVDTILLENAKIIANHEIGDVKRLKLFKQGKSFITRFHLSNIRPLAENKMTIDEIWGDAEITKSKIEIQRLKVLQDVHSLLLKGEIQNYRLLKGMDADLIGETAVYLGTLKESFSMPEIINIEEGAVHAGFNVRYKNQKIEGDGSVNLKDIRSNILDADTINAKISLRDNKIIASNLDVLYQDQKAKISAPAEIYDFDRSRLLSAPIQAEVQNLSLNNAIKILGPSFDIIKGRLTGGLVFNYDRGDMSFRPKDGFIINNFGLVVGKEKPFTILMVKKAKLKETEFAVIKKEFQMSSLIELENSLLEVDGFVNSKEARFSVVDAKVKLQDLGNIANIDLVGDGKLSIDVSGPLDDVELKFKGKMNNFGVLGYNLGTSDIDLGLSLKDSTVNIRKLDAQVGSTSLTGNGVVNYNNLDIALGINTPQTSFTDLSLILKPIFSKLDFLPQDFDLKAGVDAYIFGKTRLSDLKIKAGVKFSDLTAYGESINSGSLDVEMINETVGIKNVAAQKEKGAINGSFLINLPTKKMNVDFRWDNLALSSFSHVRRLNPNFDGNLVGKIQGEGVTSDYQFNLENKIFNTRSQNYKFNDSLIKLKLMPNRFVGDVDLVGQAISSNFDISLSRARRSNLDLQLNLPDIKPFAVALFGEHLRPETFSGKLKYNLISSFFHDLTHVDLRSTLSEMSFHHESFNVDYRSSSPELLITDSRVVRWNLGIKQPDIFLQTKGSGIFGQNLILINELHLNSKIFEVLLAPVLSSEGFIRNIITLEGRKDKYELSFKSRSEGLNLTIDGAPFPVNNLKYNLDYADRRLIINDISTTLDAGTAAFRGDVFFDDENPDINIKYVLDRAEIPILGKSIMNLTGEGIILGNQPPYTIGGEIVLNKVQIVNELSDFNTKSSALGKVRFLPKNQESPVGKLLNLNLNVKADNPIRITNSMMDISLKGELRLSGNPVRPRGEGRLFAPTNSSRVFFKNSEYLIPSADFNFMPKKDISNPDFDIQAMTFISSYKVTAKAYGDLERFNFDLTSDPALPRNSILSLIAFGYTEEIQSTLRPEDQQSLTQVGVGSFVFDRFKISDILNKQFGLQINMGTVIEQSQNQSLLSGRSQSGQGLVGQVRSATKIELKKRLDEAMTVSVSSTMGGGIGQRQSMNLTYSLNKKVQLEGVYELRTNDEGEENIIDNSLGGDVKFRWSFK